jgi:mRNA degradation ribonuclease J1/J2
MSGAVLEALSGMNASSGETTIKDRATETLNKFVYAETKRRPMIIPVLA